MKKIILYDEITVSITAPKNLTPAMRRRVILFARTIRASLGEDILKDNMPLDLKKIVNVSVN